MPAARILAAQFFAATLLAVLTWTAVLYALYWRLWWFDIPMHILGGLWAGLCIAWLMARRGHTPSLAWCLIFALFAGIGWEIFEYVEKVAQPHYFPYSVDAAKDIVMDLVGGGVGFYLARILHARDMRASESTQE